MNKLTHFNQQGDAHMVDVGSKAATHRVAQAEGWIRMQPETFSLVRDGGHKKGDVLGVARIAAIMAAKKTHELVPLCHPLMLSAVDIRFTLDESGNAVHCLARVENTGQTGVEMEALTAVQVGLLTIYDMCKAVDRGMVMDTIQLVKKSGGKSGLWERGVGDE